MPAIRSGLASKGSSSSTTRSADRPAEIVPIRDSWKVPQLAERVNRSTAAAGSIASSGRNVEYDDVRAAAKGVFADSRAPSGPASLMGH